MRKKLSEVVVTVALIAGLTQASETATKKPIKKAALVKKTSKNSGKRFAAKGITQSKPFVAAGPPRQSAPSSDRYKEIQGALSAKGYMKTPPTGVWDPDSVDAMKHYQADQKLDPTGRVNAKSLITLGLGPRDESLPSSPVIATPSK